MQLAGLLAWPSVDHLPIRLANSGIDSKLIGDVVIIFNYITIHGPYSYGDSAGFTPASLFIPHMREPIAAANVMKWLEKTRNKK